MVIFRVNKFIYQGVNMVIFHSKLGRYIPSGVTGYTETPRKPRPPHGASCRCRRRGLGEARPPGGSSGRPGLRSPEFMAEIIQKPLVCLVENDGNNGILGIMWTYYTFFLLIYSLVIISRGLVWDWISNYGWLMIRDTVGNDGIYTTMWRENWGFNHGWWRV